MKIGGNSCDVTRVTKLETKKSESQKHAHKATMPLLLVLLLLALLAPSAAFAPPALGLGALLFKPRVGIVKSGEWTAGGGGGSGDNGEALAEAGRFFVDAFW